MKKNSALLPQIQHDFHYLTNLWLAILQIGASFFHRATGIGEDIAASNLSEMEAPEFPATYAFAIWFPIFLLAIAYGIVQHLPQYRNKKIITNTRNYASAIFLFSILWMLLAQTFGNNWILVLLIALMFIYSLKTFWITTNKSDKSKLNRFLAQPLFGLYAGWLSAAVYLNFSTMLRIETNQLNLSNNQFSLITLIPFGLTALFVVSKTKFQNIWYIVGVIWAIIAILAKYI